MGEYKIAVLPGDGIGPEVTNEAIKILKVIAQRFFHNFEFTKGLIGAEAIFETGNPFPDETAELCKQTDAILFGAIGHPAFDNNPTATVRPEQGLLKMRKELGLFANVRPVKAYSNLLASSPLKPGIIKGADLVFFRELTSGIYFGKKERSADGNDATDVCTYSKEEISRITHLAFESAMQRRRKVTLVDKANVMETSRLWREVVAEISKQYPLVELNFLYVDNAAMQLMINPRQFDVILTDNLFGDILSDEASVITGSLGMLPSASIGKKVSLYEPIHGSFPGGASKNIANPYGAILSAAMMLEYSFGLTVESALIVKAVEDAIKDGFVTQDLDSKEYYSTSTIGTKVASLISEEVFELL